MQVLIFNEDVADTFSSNPWLLQTPQQHNIIGGWTPHHQQSFAVPRPTEVTNLA